MANALDDVQATFTSLDARYNVLLLACADDDDGAQKDALKLQYATAEANFQSCVGKLLEDDDPDVATLSTELQAANAQVAQSVTEMGNMSKVIDQITAAVTTGTKLLGLAGL